MSRYAADEGRLVYVGQLPDDVKEREIEDIFVKYGKVRSVDLKTPARPPPYAFVEFDDSRDAEDAVRGRDGYDFYGCKLRVELAKGGGRRDDRGGDRRDDRGRGRDGPNRGPRDFRAPNTGYRVIVKGLPGSASWQDLKDHFRKVVRPAYTNVVRERNGTIGIVEFETAEDMDRAFRKLDDTEFRNPFDRGYIRLYEDRPSRGGGRGRSPSRSRSRSPRGRSRSRSPRGGRSRSRSPRSRSRTPLSRSPSPRGRSRSPRYTKKSPSRSPMREERSKSPEPAGKGDRSPTPPPRDD